MFNGREADRFLQEFSTSISKSNSRYENNGWTLSYVQGNPKQLEEYLNSEPVALVLIPRAGLCQVRALEIGPSSPWHSAGVSTQLPSLPLQILRIPDLLIFRATMTTQAAMGGTVASHKFISLVQKVQWLYRLCNLFLDSKSRCNPGKIQNCFPADQPLMVGSVSRVTGVRS